MPDSSAVETATVDVDHGARERFIRDLYATAAFFAANPDLPAPWSVTIGVHVDSRQTVEHWAAQMGRRDYGSTQSSGKPQTDFNIPRTVTPVSIIVSNPQDPA